ncbi:hypothetical protein GCM10009745_66410 [Kribbella yunnanensis]|uniref:Ig-like domain repeat protein n=1 Tax=Kribbella yunnanensis TaxID=190194 RepID=A0ABP4URY8_9ACTN
MKAVRAVLTVSLAGAALGAAPAAHAEPGDVVTDVRLSRTSVAVSSLNTVPVTVEVDAKFPGESPSQTLHAILDRVGGTGHLDDLYSAELTRYEGTTDNGKWRGVLKVPSTANGTFQVRYVMTTGDLYFETGDEPADVVNGPKLTVTGTNQPRITVKQLNAPSPVSKPYTFRWSVINDQTGKPYGTRIKVTLDQDTGCKFGGPTTVLTDTAGYVTRTYAAERTSVPLTCLTIPGSDPFPIAKGWANSPRRIPTVAASPARTSAPVGTKVAVNGNVAGSSNRCPVHLQRLYGASQWRTVNSGQVRDVSYRYTLTAQPAYKGNIPYRVLFPACHSLTAATSKSFTIRGT